ncbi:hypothetical protein QE152_g31322 [Popillia japonica]|uniref:DUF7153 domain-containing protein n=1 Tax=Popillia japonica TaxID=7064 RepID=A0AAW1J9Z4_POPJA
MENKHKDRQDESHVQEELQGIEGRQQREAFRYENRQPNNPPRCTYTVEETEEPKCGPMRGGEQFVPLTTTSPAFSESDFPQPLVVRSPSVSLLKWPSPKNTPSRQVSFNHGNDVQSHNMENVSRTLTALDRDCFIIPVHSLERFLPAGVPMPKPTSVAPGEKRTQGSLHVMEVPDPKLCVLCHLMSPLEPIDPILESPLSQPILKQRIAAGELVSEIAQAKTSLTGMLLANMERNAEFPFISYYIINSAQTNPVLFYNNLRTASLAKFDPRVTRYTAAHTLDLYSEVASICRPPIHESGTSLTRIHTPYTGYVISVYKVFEGDDREKFERNWLYWTGARMIYRYLPAHAGLKKIALHKSVSPKGDKMYILICECSNLLKDVTVCALLLPALRARLTGYTGLFRPIQTF